ncbi:MAG: hypothetical protein ACRENE_19180 [Polyangiaceae bacterium]
MEPAPPSGQGRRTSGRAPSQWGAVRDALSAIFNLEVLLRNEAVPMKTIVDVLPEIHSSAVLLREAFEVRTASETAATEAGLHGRGRLGDLDAVLGSIARGESDRATLAGRLGPISDELEASAELLALIDRAGKGSVTEVGLDLVAREAGRLSTASRGRVLRVRFEEATPDPLVTADPFVLGSLLSLLVACVHHAGTTTVVVRTRPAPQAGFVIEAASEADSTLPTLAMRVTAWVPPTEVAVRAVAERFGAVVDIESGPRARAVVHLRRLYGGG